MSFYMANRGLLIFFRLIQGFVFLSKVTLYTRAMASNTIDDGLMAFSILELSTLVTATAAAGA